MKRYLKFYLPLLLAGLIFSIATCASPPGDALKSQAAAPAACDLAACANLVVTRDGQPGQLQAAAPFARPANLTESPWKIDTGTPSPDGAWVAYTSIGSESGGPVFLQNVKSGEWTNLIEALNVHQGGGKISFAEDYGWDVIGWFPDSARLMIGPLDLSQVLIVNLATFAAQSITFPGEGRGGRMYVNLSADGSRLVYIGDDSAGNQVMSAMDIATGQATELLSMPYQDGALSNPRYSPDQTHIAYLVQSGQPDPGLAYAINLFSTQSGQTSQLVQDTRTMTVPLWSPDGKAIAFTRGESTPSAAASKEGLAPEERTNVWVVSVADGQLTQATFVDGFMRSPTWAKDSQTLAYVTGDGQVGLVDLAQPGKSWQAAESASAPELTNVFFLP